MIEGARAGRSSVAWVLNLDADLELALPGRTSPRGVRQRTIEIREVLARSLPAGDIVLDRDDERKARGMMGRAFCPTPSALRRLERAGARVPAAPPFEVLRKVNARGFSFSMQRLPRATVARTEEEVARALARPGRWLLKREWTFAGKGHRGVDAGPPSDPDRAWIRAALRWGSVYVEPRVTVLLELGIHGSLSAEGTVRRGRVTVQQVDASGQWQRSRIAQPGELSDREHAALEDAFDAVASRLRDVGYFGPFGLDGFRWRSATGQMAFQPLSELNARYSMGWHIGMSGWD